MHMTCLGLILAGGTARRMGGRDKAAQMLAGRPLIAHVRDRLAPQVDALAISGQRAYGMDLPVIEDLCSGVQGPAAGITAAMAWCVEAGRSFDAIVTAPVDGPFLPLDLTARLAGGQGAAIATADGQQHPTYGYWPLAVLDSCSTLLDSNGGLPLMALADAAAARRVDFPEPSAFFNINSPDDLANAADLLKARPHAGRRS